MPDPPIREDACEYSAALSKVIKCPPRTRQYWSAAAHVIAVETPRMHVSSLTTDVEKPAGQEPDESTPLSHSCPENPSGQVQTTCRSVELCCSEQVPPFWHGLEAHALANSHAYGLVSSQAAACTPGMRDAPSPRIHAHESGGCGPCTQASAATRRPGDHSCRPDVGDFAADVHSAPADAGERGCDRDGYSHKAAIWLSPEQIRSFTSPSAK